MPPPSMQLRVVLNTDIFVGACLGLAACNQVVAAGLEGAYQPLMGSALFLEHEAVLSRDAPFEGCRLSQGKRSELLDIYMGRCE